MRPSGRRWTTFVLFDLLIILLVLFLSASAKSVSHPSHPSSQDPPTVGSESRIGEAVFRIARHGDSTLMEPLLVPFFKLELLEGNGIEATTITHCAVWKHVTGIEGEQIFVTTILKCGNNVYGIGEIDFQFDKVDDNTR